MIDLPMIANFSANIINVGFSGLDSCMVYNTTSILDIVVEFAYFSITLYFINRLLDKNEE